MKQFRLMGHDGKPYTAQAQAPNGEIPIFYRRCLENYPDIIYWLEEREITAWTPS